MSVHPVDVHVGKRLRLRRTMLGMSQDSIGKGIGVTFQQIQKYERGVNQIGPSKLLELAKILGVNVSYFFDDMLDSSKLASLKGFAEEEAEFEKEKLDNKETLALIRAYYKIHDPTIRKKVLSLIKAMGPANDDDKE